MRDLSEEAQAFIRENLHRDVRDLALQKTTFPKVVFKQILHQISGRQTALSKWSSLANDPHFVYPPGLHLEQASSEATANYKAGLMKGVYCLDATGGLGIDSLAFADVFEEVWHCEINAELSETAGYNFKQLGKTNIHCLAEDGLKFLKNAQLYFDWVFMDPSRRSSARTKVFRLQDCQPDVTRLGSEIFENTRNVMLKVSPLLDLTEAQKYLPGLYEVHLVSVRFEVKEMLLLLKSAPATDVKIVIHECERETEDFVFYKEEEKEASVNFGAPEKYLYEPRPGILKAGAFKLFGQKFGLNKLHPHTHLYTSSELISEIPARKFLIEAVLPFRWKNLRSKLHGKKAHVTTRNFPLSVAQIRKTIDIKEGGDDYLFFCTDKKGSKIVLKCTRINT